MAVAGLINEDKTKRVYLQIVDGSICQKSKTEREGFERVITKNSSGQEFINYVVRYKGFEGYFKDIVWFDKKIPGKEGKPDAQLKGWQLVFDANETEVILTLGIENALCSRFMKLAGNIDFSSPVTVETFKNQEKKTVLLIKQDGQSVPQVFTRENPGDLPQATQSKSTGKWNYDAVTDYLVDYMNNEVIPKLRAIVGDQEVSDGELEVSQELEDEPIPF